MACAEAGTCACGASLRERNGEWERDRQPGRQRCRARPTELMDTHTSATPHGRVIEAEERGTVVSRERASGAGERLECSARVQTSARSGRGSAREERETCERTNLALPRAPKRVAESGALVGTRASTARRGADGGAKATAALPPPPKGHSAGCSNAVASLVGALSSDYLRRMDHPERRACETHRVGKLYYGTRHRTVGEDASETYMYTHTHIRVGTTVIE